MKRFLAAVFLASLLSAGAYAQTSTVPNPSSPNLTTGTPYQEGEFPEWLTDLQRGEIISMGTFPFAVLFSGIAYDYYYYYSINGTGAAPWPMGTGTSTWTTATQGNLLNDKNTFLITCGVGISVGVALLDWVLGQAERDKKRRIQEAKRENILVLPSGGPLAFEASRQQVPSLPPGPQSTVNSLQSPPSKENRDKP